MHTATVSGDELFLVFQGETGRKLRKQEREWEARQEAISVEVQLCSGLVLAIDVNGSNTVF